MARILPLPAKMPIEPIEQQEAEQTQAVDILQAWRDIGEGLFVDGDAIVVPKIEQVRLAAELFALEIALTLCNGNITHAANDLKTSRRAIRDKLKKAKRHPWRPMWSLELTASASEGGDGD